MPKKTVERICLSPGSLGSGGIGRNMLNLAHAFLEKGIDVDLVFTGNDHYGREKFIPRNANVFQLGKRTRYALPATIRYLRKRKPGLLITAHDYVNALMLVSHRLSGLGEQCHTVITFQTCRSLQMQNSKLKDKISDCLAFKLYRNAGSLVAVSNGVAEDIEKSAGLPVGSVKTIYNPAWTREMEKKSLEICHEPWLTQKSVPVIISVGRLAKQKDFPTLLRSFAELIKKEPARLIILGEGPDRKDLESLITKLGLISTVKMPGHMDNPLAYMSKADLFVLSSAWEGFGNVIVEALGCGLPVVSTDCPSGPWEILEGGKYGELIPVGDYKTLSKALREMLANPPRKETQKARAQMFSAEKAAESFLQLATQRTLNPPSRAGNVSFGDSSEQNPLTT